MSMTWNDLPYVADEDDLTEAVTTLSNSVLWRRCGYDERTPTAEDVAAVLASLDAGREAFLLRCSQQVVPEGRRLHVVPDAG